MADLAPTVDFVPAELDQAVEGYLCGLAAGTPDHSQLIGANPSFADELNAFLRDDAWMRRLACSKHLDRVDRPLFVGQQGSSPSRTSVAPCGAIPFGDYELLEEIGRGGMGVVYKARQRSLNRLVALKMIRSAQLASEQEVQRFYTEAESAAHLDHPGIVPVYAAGELEGTHYYSMGFVEGISLHELIADQTVLPAKEAAELVRRIAEAIQYAHRRGVIHRDLKPANILLAHSDRQDAMQLPGQQGQRFEPKVTDFGLAKKIEAESELTGTGQILGTPSYMPPEQAVGESGPLSDVYSLGAVLYCLLVGAPPFRAANPVQTLQQVLHDEPVPPRRINSTVPRDLETICLKCLQKTPGRRYGSAQELAADLKRFLDGEPITARPVTAWERAFKWARRRPTTAALLVVAPIMLMAFVGLIVTQRYQGQLKRVLYARRVLAAHQAWRDQEMEIAERLLEDCESNLRGWEWDYVHRLCRTGLDRVIERPSSTTRRMVLTQEPMTREVGVIHVWDTASGHKIAMIEDDTPQVAGVQFSPDGKELEVVSVDGTGKVWNLDTLRGPRATSGLGGFPPKIAYSPDGSRLAAYVSLAFRGRAAAWARPQAGVHEHRPDRLAAYLSLALMGDRMDDSRLSEGFAAAKSDDTKMWSSGKLADAVLQGHLQISAVAFSPDRQRLASADTSGKIKVWDSPKYNCTVEWQGHAGEVYEVSFSPDGRRLASGGNDLSVRIWDALTGRRMLEFEGSDGHSGAVYGVAFHPDGEQVVSAGGDLAVRMWNVGRVTDAAILNGHAGPVKGIAFHPDGALLASAGDDGVIKLWRPHTRELVRQFRAHDEVISAVVFSPDGRLLASASDDQTVRIWNVSTGAEEPDHVLDRHQGKVYGVSFSPDGRLLASASHDGKCVIWNVATGQAQDEMASSAGPVMTTAFDPGGRFIVMGGNDLTVRNLKHGAEALLTGHEREVLSVALSPDGSRLASGSADGTVRVWRPTTGAAIATLTGHQTSVTGVAFSPAGDRVASTSWDGSVKVWDPDLQQETLSLKGQSGRAYGVAFSPDGRYLASANHDGTITLWGR
ncbi:MAG: serine/threonine protein kinase [Planctomycetes bacterium]|nr:serine/threonine protein kinase [Planctomycetota bacterium]